jgi:phosphate transport system substrate-binding protein
VQIGSGFVPGMARLAWYATPICLAAFVGGQYFTSRSENLAQQSGSVEVVGSETMRPVVTTLAADFMARNHQADIIVKGGGSGDGIAALLHGIVDIGMVSRDLSRRELDYASSQGIELAVTGLGLDGITVIVNRAAIITSLDIHQLRSIFAGKIWNWRELGGGDAEILAFARAADSGTASLFEARVLGEETYAASVRLLPTNESIVAEVATRFGAIGYADLGALRGAGDRIKSLALRIEPELPLPTSDTIRSGSYPLARTLNLATAATHSGVAKAFIDFCLGANGQALLERAGYLRMKQAAQ